ncbi:MAG: ABC transporter substrate-binding protein, partial [Pseudomonadota bacterium]
RHPERTVLDLIADDPCSAGCCEDNLVVQQGADGKPVRAIGAMLQETPLVLMTKDDSGIKAIRDLAGRRVAVHADGEHLLRILLHLHDVDVDTVDITVGGWSLDDLTAERFDAVQGYAITEAIALEAHGFSPRLVPLRHPSLAPQSQVIVTTPECLSSHETILRRFLAATAEGWLQVLAQPDEAAAMLAATCAGRTDASKNRRMLAMMAPLVVGAKGPQQICQIDRERWRQNIATYARFGLGARKVDVDNIVDDLFT